MDTGPILLVEWVDSARPSPEWQWLDERREPEAVRCLSVGYMIAETEEVVALAANLGDIGQLRQQACAIIHIPRCAILRLNYLKIDDDEPADGPNAAMREGIALHREWIRGRGETVNAEGLNPVHAAGSTPAGPTTLPADPGVRKR